MKPSSHVKPKVLLLDLYEWTEAYPASNPLRNVSDWFARRLPVGDQFELQTVSVNDDLLARAREVAAVIITSTATSSATG